MSSTSSYASVKHALVKHCPVLTAGSITPQTMLLFENACNEFFISKSIDDDDRVKNILGAFKDVHVRDWVASERRSLLLLTFEDFMSELRKNFLPEDWVEDVRADLLGMRLKKGGNFFHWAQEMKALNIVLRGSPSHLDDATLRNQMEAALHSELRTACSREEIHKITDLKPWIERVKKVDERLESEKKRYREIFAEESSRSSKRPALANYSRTANTTSSSATIASSQSRVYPPKLTPAEIALLRLHHGCFKCRRFNQNHSAKDCPLDSPSGVGYKPIAATCDAAGNAPKTPPFKAVSTITSAPTSTASDGDSVMAVLPVASILTNTAESVDSDDSVSPPLRLPHLFWPCNVFSSLTDFPVQLKTFLDCGSHLVLISPATVDSLALPRFTLSTPENIEVAIGDGSSKKCTTLYEYVKFSATSLDSLWTSRTVHALIAPGLCTPVLLGLPFLCHNKLVMDYEAGSCIDKKTGYDLLNPPPITPPKPRRLSPKARIKAVQVARKDMLRELKLVCAQRLSDNIVTFEDVKAVDVVGAVRARIEQLASQETLLRKDTQLRTEYSQIFEPIPHIDELPSDVFAEIHIKDPEKTIRNRSYPSPRKYQEAWHILIQQHLEAGRIRPSSSSYASPAFIVPKTDPSALPRWVNDYRDLNANTITDAHPLPRVDDILNACAKGKIWGTIDMTNSFFQTRMHPDHVHLTAVNTPLGLYEWLVMPMGLKNSPSIHQRRVTAALRPLLGRICHIYLDDIVIWSNSLDEHDKNVRAVLDALQAAKLYVNPKKTKLFCSEIDFLGHHISSQGIEADSSKVDKILAWPIPTSSTEARSFLGLVRYISAFLPNLADHTHVLTELTTKDADKQFPLWSQRYQVAFDAIKAIVTGRDCLTTIDFSLMPEYKIFLTTDASDFRSGAVLAFGPSWDLARPVAFDSMTFKGAELNYPVHEKELLAIIRALKKWRADLLGSPFLIYTDHKTLENFNTQRDLSRRQARWMEIMSQFDAKIVYVKGEDNTVADALSRLPLDPGVPPEQMALPPCSYDPETLDNILCVLPLSTSWDTASALSSLPPTPDDSRAIGSILSISADTSFLREIRSGYLQDPWIKSLSSASESIPGLTQNDGLWYVGDRLIIPRTPHLRETLFRLAHDVLGHFGFDKTYATLRTSYYWPNMRKDLELGYVPSCAECQRNKSSTIKPIGPLHPLPIPDDRGDSVAIDFIGPLPPDDDMDCIVTFTDRLGSDIRLIPCQTSITAPELAALFFTEWYCENGLPLDIVSDRDKLFVSTFWKSLHLLTGTKLKMSTAYHPETDGASERTNKTVNQCLRFFVERNQRGWVKALPLIRFNIMNTVNKSTGFSPFQLRMGRSPRLIPPLLDRPSVPACYAELHAIELIKNLEQNTKEAQDNLLRAKISQSFQANKSRMLTFPFKIGDRVRLSTFNRRHEYKTRGDKRVAKFMPRFDGPYTVLNTNSSHSTVTLDLPNSPNICNVFHTSEVLPFLENDPTLYPSREYAKPPPVTTDHGDKEWYIRDIIDERRRGRGFQYLVRWLGYDKEFDRWLPGSELEDTEALDIWLARNRCG